LVRPLYQVTEHLTKLTAARQITRQFADLLAMNADSPQIDPQQLPVLEEMRRRVASRAPPWELTPQVMRARMRQDLAPWNENPPQLSRVEEMTLAGSSPSLNIRRYEPATRSGPQPALVYLHGGGWVAGDLDTEDRALRLLALESGITILSVDYPLAPEHRFPIALNACVAAWHSLLADRDRWRIDPLRLALGGSSAGANLALSCALELRDAGILQPRCLILNYGVYSSDFDTPSARRFGDGAFGLSVAQMEYFLSQYLERPELATDPRVSPLLADLCGLSRVFMTAASLDPLLDDSLRLDAALTQAGVPHECVVYPGVIHGFTLMNTVLEVAKVATRDMASALRETLT